MSKICKKCEAEFDRGHPAQKYCNECRGVLLTLGPLDVYSPERWSVLQGNYEFDPQIGRARCKEMSSNIALPSPGDPAYRETPAVEDMLTFNDLPIHDRMVIDHESDASDPELTRESLIECALKYNRIFGGAHAHEFGAK